MTVGEMIKNRRTALGMTLEEVGHNVGVTKNTVRKWETGLISNMKRDKIAKLAAILELDPTDFISDKVSESLNFPRNMIPADIISDSVPVPVIGAAAAGLACHAEENIEYYEYAPRSIISSNETYAYLRVQGDSMSPTIMEGDLALIRCQTSIDNGEVAVVIIDDEDGVVKRVKYDEGWIELVSENPSYPPRRFEGKEVDRVRIFGRVMECKRRF
ncbi:MAG: XRE family transcriptional regulator [Oscillospiraceae bacterium]|nr:XRE family transcriptional regulator [Oscillospiraceae bacterium]